MLNELLGTSYIGTSGLWFDIAIDVTVKGSLILLVAGLLVYSFRSSAASRHLIWSVGLGRFLVLPLLELALPRWQVAILPASLVRSSDDRSHNGSTDDRTSIQTTNVSRTLPPLPRQAERLTNAPSAVSGPILNSSDVASTDSRGQLSWTAILLVIWFVGTILVLGRLAIGTINGKRIIRRASPVTDTEWLRQ